MNFQNSPEVFVMFSIKTTQGVEAVLLNQVFPKIQFLLFLETLKLHSPNLGYDPGLYIFKM